MFFSAKRCPHQANPYAKTGARAKSHGRFLKIAARAQASARPMPMACSVRFVLFWCARTYSGQNSSKVVASLSMARLRGSEVDGDLVQGRHLVPRHAPHDAVEALFDLAILRLGRHVDAHGGAIVHCHR